MRVIRSNTMSKRARRAAIYCRISKDTAGLGAGVERQERECRELADSLGLDVVAVYVDNDVSAYRGKKRPGYEALIDAMRAGQINTVLAWHPDRLTRQPRELEDLIDVLEGTGTDVATVSAGAYDLSTPAGRLGARTVGAAARYESEQKSARHRSKARQLAEQGRVGGGGTRPYGFADDRRTVVEAEADTIREAADLIVAGWSLRRVCRHLNESGRRTVTGTDWSAMSLRRCLTSPRVAGLRQHQGEVIGEAEWPAILDRPVWERVRLTLLDPARRTNQRMTRYLLASIVYTDLGVPMVARPNDRKVRRYFAAPDGDKPGGAIGADDLEALVVEAVLQRFDEVPLIAARRDDDDDLSAVAAIEAELDELAAMRGEGVITMREWVAAREPLLARLEGARGSVRSTSTPTVPATAAGDLRAAWPALTFDQRQDVLRAVVNRVVIAPAVRGRNTFDAERVTIDYRG